MTQPEITLSAVCGEQELSDPALTGEWAAVMEELKDTLNTPPWCFYLASRDAEPVGSGAFKGPPDAQGYAEIAFITFIPARGQGVATQIASQLIAIARCEGLSGLRAHTLPELNASTRVLEVNGFRHVGEVLDPEDGLVWRWERAMSEVTGGCMCGRIRYAASIQSEDAYLCHCRMCQRASGNVSLAMKNVPQAAVQWEREPDYYRSSPIARRGFCSVCGTSLTFQYLEGIDKMDLIVGTFDDPSRFKPDAHFGTESMHRAWLDTTGLPETRSDEYQPLNDRWMEAVGKLPE